MLYSIETDRIGIYNYIEKYIYIIYIKTYQNITIILPPEFDSHLRNLLFFRMCFSENPNIILGQAEEGHGAGETHLGFRKMRATALSGAS